MMRWFVSMAVAWLLLMVFVAKATAAECVDPLVSEVPTTVVVANERDVADMIVQVRLAAGSPIARQMAEDAAESIVRWSERLKVDPWLLVAIAWRESRFRPWVSRRDEGDERIQCGPYQQQARYSPGFDGDLAIECDALKDWEYATRIAALKLRRLERRGLGVCAYNGGSGCPPGSRAYEVRVWEARDLFASRVCPVDM